MADDRTIRVRLLAEIQNYQQGMKQAAATTAQFARDNQAQIQSVGASMTKYLTLPLAAVGVASVKMAGDFETSFANLVGLAGVPASEVDGLRQSVLDLAGETAVAPQELADALYFAASAGLDAAAAMDAVEVAARGSAAGLGRTEDIVGLVASAVASYGDEAITAAEATDILTATIREGRADPDELAGTLGRLLPIASQLDVSFDQVGGAVAYLSNVFGDTNRTVTALQGFLVKLVSPTKQGRDALEDMGTSVEELQAAISSDGLQGALELLREKGFAGNQQALRALFDDIEGFQAALALINDESGTLAETFDKVGDSAGSLEEALGERLGTDAQKAKQAIVDMQVALIEVGTVLAPIAADIAGFASMLIGWFTNLPEPVQNLAVAFGAFVAAAGPAILIGSKLFAAWVVVAPMLQTLALKAMYAQGALVGMAAPLAAVAAAVGAGLLVWKRYSDEMGEVGDAADAMADRIIGSFDVQGASADDLNKRIEFLVDQHNKLTERGNNAGDRFTSEGYHRAAEAVGAEADAMKELRDEAIVLRDDLDLTSDAALDMARNEDVMAAATENATGEIDSSAAALADQEAQLQENVDAWQALADELAAQFDPLFAAVDAMQGMADAAEAVSDAEREVAEATKARDDAIKEHGRGSDEAAEATRNLEDAERNLQDAQAGTVDAAYANEQAQLALRTAVEAGEVSVEDAVATLQRWVDEGHITQEEANKTAYGFALVTNEANKIPRSINISVTANTASVHEQLRIAAEAVNNFNATRGTNLNVYRGQGAIYPARGGAVAEYLATGGSPFVPRGSDTVPAMLSPGEFIMSTEATNRLGSGFLSALNEGVDARRLVGATGGYGGTSTSHTTTQNFSPTLIVDKKPGPIAMSHELQKLALKVSGS